MSFCFWQEKKCLRCPNGEVWKKICEKIASIEENCENNHCTFWTIKIIQPDLHQIAYLAIFFCTYYVAWKILLFASEKKAFKKWVHRIVDPVNSYIYKHLSKRYTLSTPHHAPSPTLFTSPWMEWYHDFSTKMVYVDILIAYSLAGVPYGLTSVPHYTHFEWLLSVNFRAIMNGLKRSCCLSLYQYDLCAKYTVSK